MKHTMPVSRAKTAYGLLAEIRRLILIEPKRYNQYTTLTFGDQTDKENPRCGTVGCVAGWTVALKRRRPWAIEDVLDTAGKILQLTPNQEDELFSDRAVQCNAQTPAHARKGAAHIAKFMKANKQQLRRTRV